MYITIIYITTVIIIEQIVFNMLKCAEDVLGKDEPQEGKPKRSILSNCREYLANYQESCGTPHYADYSYAALITTMVQAAARCLWALICVIVNVVPVIQVTVNNAAYVSSILVSAGRGKSKAQRAYFRT